MQRYVCSRFCISFGRIQQHRQTMISQKIEGEDTKCFNIEKFFLALLRCLERSYFEDFHKLRLISSWKFLWDFSQRSKCFVILERLPHESKNYKYKRKLYIIFIAIFLKSLQCGTQTTVSAFSSFIEIFLW